MPVKRLPPTPNLEHLKAEARRLLQNRAAGDRQACQRVREFHPKFSQSSDEEIGGAKLSWSDGLFLIAREHGFASWARLRTAVLSSSPETRTDCYLARITDPIFRSAVECIEKGNIDALRHLLAAHPDLIERRAHFDGENYFRDPALLAFIAENPVRTDRLPPNIVEIGRLLLEQGAGRNQADLDETVELVASGRVPREADVQDHLIRLLCSSGANPDNAMIAALAHGEFQAAQTLLECGARTTLPVAAALGDVAGVEKTLPTSQRGERHLALALASQHGRADVLEILLKEGEDPNRYNPVGAHAHCTPLHQAAYNGHGDTVRVLLKHGANPTLRDVMWNATPLDWARHGHQEAVMALLGAGEQQ